MVPEDECLGNTRKGKQVLNVTAPDEARAMTRGRGRTVAAIGENRKLIIFPLDQVPEMTRGRGVRLQRFKDGSLSDVKTFKAADGLTWIDAGGRVFVQTLKELAAWRGNRGDAGRVRPDRFLDQQQVRPAASQRQSARREVTAARGVGQSSLHRSCPRKRASSLFSACEGLGPRFRGDERRELFGFALRTQLATNTMEIGASSNTVAAVSPKNSRSPGRRLTPMMIRSCWPDLAALTIALSGARPELVSVFNVTS